MLLTKDALKQHRKVKNNRIPRLFEPTQISANWCPHKNLPTSVYSYLQNLRRSQDVWDIQTIEYYQ